MIHLRFSIAGPRQIMTAPAASFRFSAREITALPGQRPVARFSSRMWQVDGRYFTRCECREPARVQFEDAEGHLTDPVGPFNTVDLYGGSLYADKTLLARFDEARQVWGTLQPQADFVAIIVGS
ncbi:MAG TPA: hypothetical protein VF161_06025 [Steroidobacteraceae bacterium]|jgi:hypothetical protein